MAGPESSYIDPDDWQALARCSDPEIDPMIFFSGLKGVEDPVAMERRAKIICNTECLVKQECLEDALQHGYADIRGGTNEKERKAIALDRRKTAGEGIFGLRVVGRLARRIL